jgi:hypothetical protein
MTPLSQFTDKGVDVGSRDRAMTYLYGLSDFFTFIFEDTDTVNLILEANAIKASDIYSKFLQLTSSLTLADIQEKVGTSIKLVLLTETDKIGSTPKYRIQQPLSSCKFITNRPFLPTETLTEDVDFRLTQESTTSCILEFAKPIGEYRFSTRILSGNTNQYALWMTDVRIDEQLMFNHYGTLLGVRPEISTEQFSNFIYGLYYLYLSGPTLSVIEKGLNLVLGIPLPREDSTIIDIRIEVETNQYSVITNNNKYTLPAGILPEVFIGDTLAAGASIAKWIELKDFVSDGDWWINVSIPEQVIRTKPKSQIDRFARIGNRYDQLMREFLFRNTFLIRINVGSFTDNRYFSYLNEIISKGKPSYAQPVFVWKVDLGEDDFGFIEEINFTITQISAFLRSINAMPINQAIIN